MFSKKSISKLTPRQVEDRLGGKGTSRIIDVRESGEWASGHIPGARHIPLSMLPLRLGELDRGSEYIMVCQSGGRSARACEYLTQNGYRAVDMAGGMSGWSGPLAFGQ